MARVYRNLPNWLTLMRLLMAAVFILVLNQYRYGAPDTNPDLLWWAMGLFIVASLTDIADGYLARRWKVESTFGRIMDPFVDKVLVLAAFIYLAGPRFVDPEEVQAGSWFTMVSGVYPWMVVLILARELLVTGIRGEMESRGIQFGAKVSGKLKTLLQSITIPVVLGCVALDAPPEFGANWKSLLRDGFVYAVAIATLLSGIPYITSAAKAMKSGTRKPPGARDGAVAATDAAARPPSTPDA